VDDPEAEPGNAESVAPTARICRTIRPGTNGADVIAVKRALSRAGFMQWGAFTPIWGPNALRACKAFQAANGIPQTGDYGPRTHTRLLATPPKAGGGESAWDAHGLRMLHDFCELTRDEQVRRQIVAAAEFWNARRDEIDYALQRPFPLASPPGVPPWSDCSGFVTLCHMAAGAKNPNAQGGQRLPWNGHGYTGTLIDGGRRRERAEDLRPGDAVFYGFTKTPSPAFPLNSPTHVALWIGDGKVITHGKSSGPERQHYLYWTEINCFVSYDVV
jgi:peptidoglycan hydrolase-like protein with peptidoglycan-binding domain